MLFESLPRQSAMSWDKFEVRNIGLAVQRRMAGKYGGDAEAGQNASVEMVSRALRINHRSWNPAELAALQNLSLVLASNPALGRWSSEQKELATRVIRAKGGPDEARHHRLIQKHAAFRDVLMKLGCR
jgi:hypothetical protein